MADFWGECFYGRPLQNHSEINAALFEGTGQDLSRLIAERLAAGDLAESCKATLGATVVSLLEVPAQGPVRTGILFAGAEKCRPEIVSVYPVLEGIANPLTLLNYKAWDDGVMGMLACESASAGSIGFFDPFYFRDCQTLRRGVRRDFAISGVACNIVIAKNEEVEITHGQIYEDHLAEFLKLYPDRTRADFPGLRVILGSLQMMYPTEQTGNYHYRALVLDREGIRFGGATLTRFHLCIGLEGDDRAPELWLYAAPHAITGREPRIGDYIEGYCALFGYPC